MGDQPWVSSLGENQGDVTGGGGGGGGWGGGWEGPRGGAGGGGGGGGGVGFLGGGACPPVCGFRLGEGRLRLGSLLAMPPDELRTRIGWSRGLPIAGWRLRLHDCRLPIEKKERSLCWRPASELLPAGSRQQARLRAWLIANALVSIG